MELKIIKIEFTDEQINDLEYKKFHYHETQIV